MKGRHEYWIAMGMLFRLSKSHLLLLPNIEQPHSTFWVKCCPKWNYTPLNPLQSVNLEGYSSAEDSTVNLAMLDFLLQIYMLMLVTTVCLWNHSVLLWILLLRLSFLILLNYFGFLIMDLMLQPLPHCFAPSTNAGWYFTSSVLFNKAGLLICFIPLVCWWILLKVCYKNSLSCHSNPSTTIFRSNEINPVVSTQAQKPAFYLKHYSRLPRKGYDLYCTPTHLV